ncbi:MAG TPA: hypothetical protein VH986_04045, partial [Acidimicrobiia bacterium]
MRAFWRAVGTRSSGLGEPGEWRANAREPALEVRGFTPCRTRERVAELPDEIGLDLPEVAIVLGALDRAAELTNPDTDAYRAIRRATRLITRKVWPELGDLMAVDEELTTTEAARRLGIEPEYVYERVLSGKLTSSTRSNATNLKDPPRPMRRSGALRRGCRQSIGARVRACPRPAPWGHTLRPFACAVGGNLSVLARGRRRLRSDAHPIPRGGRLVPATRLALVSPSMCRRRNGRCG